MVTENSQQSNYNMADLLMLVWQRKWLCIILSVVAVLVALTIALLMPKKYTADISIFANLQQAGQIESQLSSIGNIFGMSSSTGSQEELYIAKLQSREFIYAFINRHNLLPILFEDKWDAGKNAWKTDEDAPTVHDGYNKFIDKVFDLYRDYKTGITKISINWYDPKLAADWANNLIRDFNLITAEKEQSETEGRIQYLSNAMENASFKGVQRALATSIESELRSNILAHTSNEFAFKIIDPAVTPNTPSSPKIVIYLFTGLLCGFIFSLFVIAFLEVKNSVRE